jgi:hypothetical protein
MGRVTWAGDRFAKLSIGVSQDAFAHGSRIQRKLMADPDKAADGVVFGGKPKARRARDWIVIAEIRERLQEHVRPQFSFRVGQLFDFNHCSDLPFSLSPLVVAVD